MTGIAYVDRDDWLAKRRDGIGGSDAAAILGVSPWRTPNDVWEDKLGIAEERPATAAMEWGNRLEDVVADAISDRLGVRLRRSRKILVHPELPFVFANVDRLFRDAIVEIKTARSGDDFATEEEAPNLPPIDRVPKHYYVQGQHYAAVTGKPRILFGVLVGGSDLRLLEVPADPEFIRDLLEEEATFWNRYVVPGVRPPLAAGDVDRVARLFPHGSGEKVSTPEVDELIRRLLAVRDREDAIAKERAELEVRIKDYLGEASDLVSGVAKATWRERKGSIGWSQVAGSLRSALERLREGGSAATVHDLDEVLSEGFGTTDLDEVEELYRGEPSRSFLLDRKGANR